jgi:multiple sugar transport system ATP-binding protein
MNLVPVAAMVDGGQLRLRADGLTLPSLPISDAIAKAAAKGKMTLGIRPEHLRMAEAGDANTIAGKLFANENMGPESLVTMERADSGRVTARIFTDDEIRTGDQVTLSFDTRHVTLFDETGARIPATGE